MRRALAGAGIAAMAAAVLLAAPATATADVIFDQADAEDLAATLDEAFQAQGVCYGWAIDVDNVGLPESSYGSNFGANTRLSDAAEFDQCDTTVEFQADIRWTSESSEIEDSASYRVESLPEGPTTADLDSLELVSEDGLVSDNVDLDVYKAVSSLPLLAADAGVAEPMEASPAPETAAQSAGGEPTNSPGSDFWREAGGAVLFSLVLLVGGGVFAFWALRSPAARRRAEARAAGNASSDPPAYVPPEWSAGQRTRPPGQTRGPGGPDRPGQPGRAGPGRPAAAGQSGGGSAASGQSGSGSAASGQPGAGGSAASGQAGAGRSGGGSGGSGRSARSGSGAGQPGSGQPAEPGAERPGAGGPGSSGPGESGAPPSRSSGRSGAGAGEPDRQPPRSSNPPGGQPDDSPNPDTRPET